jgi:DnaJ like chaperone protein
LEKIARTLGFRRVELDFLIITFEAEQRFRSGRSQEKRQHGQSQKGRKREQHQSQYNAHNSYSAKAELDDAYKILGISSEDEPAVIKKAYRRQMSLHHPDKMASKGLPAQALELSKQKAQDIQSAYELIRKHKKL